MDIKAYLEQKRVLLDAALSSFLPGDDSVLSQAMRYSALAPGKRIRAVLAIASAETVGGDPGAVMPAACAIEMIHAFSLIHDDLPAMDDDDMRRGIPTCHIKFGEAQAILAGDALFALAYRVLSDKQNIKGLDPVKVLSAISDISKAAGCEGMCMGQSLDLSGEGKRLTFEELRTIHKNKTGELIRTSVHCGALLGGGTDEQIKTLDDYAVHLGLAFQIKDDILDLSGTLEEIGKPPGSDIKKGKATYPSILGMEMAADLLETEKTSSFRALSMFGEKALVLKALAEYVVERKK